MKAVIQRVSKASVKVDGNVAGSIGRGVLVLVGFTDSDKDAEIGWVARKLAGMRIFEDDEGKLNRSLLDVHGSALVVSQFTLYADIRKGRRPSFVKAAKPERAKELYERFCELLVAEEIAVEKGVFGAKMDIELINSGPVTIIMEK